MVQCDLCDGDYVCVGGGGGVEAATQSGFENGEVDVRLTKSEQGDRGYLFEKSGPSFELFGDFANGSRASRKLFVGYLGTGKLDALCDRDEVR